MASAMTYIDGLDQDKVTRTLAEKGSALTERWHTDDQRFALWLQLCNRNMAGRIGFGVDDIEDWTWRDAYDAGMDPRSAVNEALEHSGMGEW